MGIPRNLDVVCIWLVITLPPCFNPVGGRSKQSVHSLPGEVLMSLPSSPPPPSSLPLFLIKLVFCHLVTYHLPCQPYGTTLLALPSNHNPLKLPTNYTLQLLHSLPYEDCCPPIALATPWNVYCSLVRQYPELAEENTLARASQSYSIFRADLLSHGLLPF